MRTHATLLLAALFGVLGCGSASTPIRGTADPVAETTAHAPLPELTEGSCGGFAGRAPMGPVALLGGRLSIRPFEGLESSARPTDIMSAPVAPDVETRLFAARDEDRFVVLSSELFATAGDDLYREVAGLEMVGHTTHELDHMPMPAVVSLPSELDTSHEAVPLLHLFTVTSDGLVQRTTFFVTPSVARTGGCQRAALALARTMAPGERVLSTSAGPRTLVPGALGIELPESAYLRVEGLHDFSVYHVQLRVPLSAAPASLGVYVGSHPQAPEADGATEVAGRLMGRDVNWLERRDEDGLRREVLMPHPSARFVMHVFLGARDEATYAALIAIAESLTASTSARALPSCPASPAAPAPTPAVPDDSDLAVLMSAPSFTGAPATWARASVSESAAFRALVSRPHAAAAFRHLALAATTTEGRLYGLAGLQLVDPEGFERIVCFVRSELPAHATGLTECGEVELDVASLLESNAQDAVRGEPHWGELEWGDALRSGTADIRGGGTGRALLHRDVRTTLLANAAALLEGTGFIPALDQNAPTVPPLVSGTRALIAAPFAGGHVGGGCAVRVRDGRVGCWGGARPVDSSRRRSASEAMLLPDVLRYPTAMDGRFGSGCMLDAEGTRVCWGSIEEAARARAEACGGPLAPSAPLIMRRHDDGPWERLAYANVLCGIRPNGALHCFPHSLERLPDWARLDPAQRSYPVPIEGHVEGVVSHYNDAIAWTREGVVYSLARAAVSELGRFEGGIRSVSEGMGGAVFAQLTDGRVMAYGARADWHRAHGPPVRDWREIATLRGASVVLDSYHGCALFDDGRVECFGKADAFTDRDEGFHDLPPTEVAALRGARFLFVDQRRSCGWMPGDRVRCVGLEGHTGAGLTAHSEVSEVDVPALLRRAVAIPAVGEVEPAE